MSSLEKMLELLVKALRYLSSRTENVRLFQRCFWDSQQNLKHSIEQDSYDILADLAYDLQFLQADPGVRAQNSNAGNAKLK
jgi:hypothetical protein